MVRLELSIQLQYDVLEPTSDFIFNLQAAHTARQVVVREALSVTPGAVVGDLREDVDAATHSRFTRLTARQGAFVLDYEAVLDLHHHTAEPADLIGVSARDVPVDVLPYLVPSRYCQSDRLMAMAQAEFGHTPPGYGRAQAICDWVGQHVRFQSNTSSSATSALDTVVDRTGVCRDFAHLMVALCRAINLPARMASGIDYGADPALGPTDFHAYVEVYLADRTAPSHAGRWYLFDPSGTAIPMGFVRFGTGRDAADIAFATIMGGVNTYQPVIAMRALAGVNGQLVEPVPVGVALSTSP